MYWLNGRLLADDEPGLLPTDRGFALGDGVFETVRTEDGRPRWLADHLARLARGAALLGIPLPYDGTVLAGAAAAVARPAGPGLVRVTLTRGPGAFGLAAGPGPAAPSLAVVGLGLPARSALVRLVVARTVRRNELSPASGIKSLSYVDNVLAVREAVRRGADDALLLNTQGRFAEASGASLLVAMPDGTVLTPPCADGALPGIARHRLVAAGRVAVSPVTADTIGRARAILLCNSLGVRRAVALDGRAVASDAAAAEALSCHLFAAN